MKFLVLARSDKFGKLCVAGFDLNPDHEEFVRLGHGKNCDPISADEFRINGKPIQLCDIITVDVEKLDDQLPQTENYELNEIISFDGKMSKEELIATMDSMITADHIFGNDRWYLVTEEAESLDYSIMFEIVYNLTITKKINSETNRPSYSCSFNYNNDHYSYVSVTDPEIKGMFDPYSDSGSIHYEKACILFSLPNPNDEWVIKNRKFYKYASGIIQL